MTVPAFTVSTEPEATQLGGVPVWPAKQAWNLSYNPPEALLSASFDTLPLSVPLSGYIKLLLVAACDDITIKPPIILKQLGIE